MMALASNIVAITALYENSVRNNALICMCLRKLKLHIKVPGVAAAKHSDRRRVHSHNTVEVAAQKATASDLALE
jgi:hypothetical protein